MLCVGQACFKDYLNTKEEAITFCSDKSRGQSGWQVLKVDIRFFAQNTKIGQDVSSLITIPTQHDTLHEF